MNLILDPMITSIFGAVSVLLGRYLKRNPAFLNRWIPIMTLVTTLLGQMIAAATAQAGFLDTIVKGVTWANALIVWLATTGLVSVSKNTVMGKTSQR